MKKRITALAIAIIMALSTSSIAMADMVRYETSMNNYDYSPSLRKINDTRPVDNNTYCIRTSTGGHTSYSTSVWKNKSYRLSTVSTMASKGRKEWKLPKRDDGNIQLRLENTKSYKVTVVGGFWLYP